MNRDGLPGAVFTRRNSKLNLEADKGETRFLPTLAHAISQAASHRLIQPVANGETTRKHQRRLQRSDTLPSCVLDTSDSPPKSHPATQVPTIFQPSDPNTQRKLSKISATTKHLKDTFRDLTLAERLPKASDAEVAKKFANLPRTKKAKTVVFDLDETLIHRVGDVTEAEAVVQITLPSGDKMTVGFNIRPFAMNCLRELSSHWEVVVFTASQQYYADAILDYLDPARVLIAHRLYRQHCLQIGVVVVKDLRVLGRNLKDVVIVDNSARSFAFQLDNGVPIREWTTSKRDRELEKLTGFLKRLHMEEDVRVLLRKTFDLQRFTEDYREAIRRK